MYIDKNLTLSALQAVTSTAASTNIVNQGAAGDAYESLFFLVRVGTAATAAGSATVTITLETATDADFTTPVVLFSTSAIAKASLTANTEIVKVRIPVGCLQYIRANYTVATGPLSAGTFDAFLVNDVKIGSQ